MSRTEPGGRDGTRLNRAMKEAGLIRRGPAALRLGLTAELFDELIQRGIITTRRLGVEPWSSFEGVPVVELERLRRIIRAASALGIYRWWERRNLDRFAGEEDRA